MRRPGARLIGQGSIEHFLFVNQHPERELACRARFQRHRRVFGHKGRWIFKRQFRCEGCRDERRRERGGRNQYGGARRCSQRLGQRRNSGRRASPRDGGGHRRRRTDGGNSGKRIADRFRRLQASRDQSKETDDDGDDRYRFRNARAPDALGKSGWLAWRCSRDLLHRFRFRLEHLKARLDGFLHGSLNRTVRFCRRDRKRGKGVWLIAPGHYRFGIRICGKRRRHRRRHRWRRRFGRTLGSARWAHARFDIIFFQNQVWIEVQIQGIIAKQAPQKRAGWKHVIVPIFERFQNRLSDPRFERCLVQGDAPRLACALQ